MQRVYGFSDDGPTATPPDPATGTGSITWIGAKKSKEERGHYLFFSQMNTPVGKARHGLAGTRDSKKVRRGGDRKVRPLLAALR